MWQQTYPRPMRADARRNYERILVTARDVLTESGADASLDEIARRADVGIGTLYRHFPTREDLLDAVMHSTFVDLHDLATELLQADDPADALETYTLFWLRHTAEYRDIAAECMRGALERDPQHAPHCQATQDDSHRLLDRAQQSGQIRADVTYKGIWRLLNGVMLGLKDANVEEEEALTMLDVVFQGLRARPADNRAPDQ